MWLEGAFLLYILTTYTCTDGTTSLSRPGMPAAQSGFDSRPYVPPPAQIQNVGGDFGGPLSQCVSQSL